MPAGVPPAARGAAGRDGCGLTGPTDTLGVGTTDGGATVGLGRGRKSSSTGRGVLFGCGSGSNGTQPTPVNSTSGQAYASAPRTVPDPWMWKPTTTRLGSPMIRASTANDAANCSLVPRWPPAVRGPNRKNVRLGYACPLGASDTSV